MADIESIIRANVGTLDIALIREYFSLFNREKELKEILKRVDNAD
jgi:hypothetical protein